jgi:FMN hydrolase / 5-amino-6-(5-phospho-D-ribitylamino)uracil phosphatase
MTVRNSNHDIPRGYDYRLDPLPRLVLFDLDDTLCDHASSLANRVRHAFEPFFEDDLLHRAAGDAIARSREGTAHFAEILGHYGVESANAAELARERYLSDRYRGLRLYDDSLGAIACVKSVAGIGMITNGPTSIQQPKIDLLEIEHHFPFILISESVGIWKPDPAIFEMALEIAGVHADDAIYVGDSPVADVPGARAAGMRSVWINRAGADWTGDEPPHVEIRDLDELLVSLGIAR